MIKHCDHIDCHNSEMVWLPIDQRNKELKKHYFCIKCGSVKNRHEPAARTIGYYVNILSDIRRYLKSENKKAGRVITKLTNTQIRLIVKEMEAISSFNDTYTCNKNSQDQLFLEITGKYISSIRREQLSNFLN